ncbi:TIGR03643 family protein [Balneola sp. MJW-20]|uniref:TIGR03643 family protein n=1 Tax=Gracilimonas aurantiaca TaxID=3234185 RepID=UPI00346566D2
MSHNKELSEADKSRIIEMAWEDRTPFDAIEFQFGLSEKETIELMRSEMKRTSFKMWRERVSGRDTKHRKKRKEDVNRFVSPNQY